MPSHALVRWRNAMDLRLKKVEVARLTVGGRDAFARLAAEQMKHAYVVLLSSHFQAFCRDLHTEAVDHLYPAAIPVAVQGILKMLLTQDRKLDRGNPNPGNIGSDFNRFNFNFWQEVLAHDSQNADRRARLESLNQWRNAISHQDFTHGAVAGGLGIGAIQKWRSACDRLARSFDVVVSRRLSVIIGHAPW